MNYTSKERPNEENGCETYELELLEDGETIPVEDLGHIDDSGHEKIVENQLQEDPYTEKLKEEKREEENVDPRTLRTEMSDFDIEPLSMRLRCFA